jgi:SpoVK/Ycf46/Vps4 family AAA+-type ATPase
MQPMLKQKDLKPNLLDNLVQDALQQAVGTNTLVIDESGVKLPLSALVYALKTVGKLSPTSDKAPAEDLSKLCENDFETNVLSGLVAPDQIDVKWDSIGGLKDVKELLREFTVYPLKYPELYSAGTVASAPKGVLLFGPPGTGKTMLAKAVATESGSAFITIDAPTMNSKWKGESEKLAKAVFTLARKISPCVIFIDELDSILAQRSDDEADHVTATKTTLLQEWDGVGGGNEGVVVIGATNRPWTLDEAILRRMPRRLLVDLPNEEQRLEILRVWFSPDSYLVLSTSDRASSLPCRCAWGLLSSLLMIVIWRHWQQS